MISKSTNLKETAYEHIKELMLGGKLKQDVIYSERKISMEIGVSRTPFHAALQQLEQDGYIDILPSRGFVLRKLTYQDIVETYEVRSAVEFYCAYALARDYQKGEGADTVEALKETLDRQRVIAETSGDIEEFMNCDLKFHTLIVNYKKNQTLRYAFLSHIYKIKHLANNSLEHEGRVERTVLEHQGIVDAIVKGDVDQLLAATMLHFDNSQALDLEDLENSPKA